MRVGVFGAGGFIGAHLTRRLLERGHDVVAVSRRPEPELEELGARVVVGELTDHDTMRSALTGLDTVVQLMGSSTPAQGIARSTQDIEENVIPQVAFLRHCVEYGVARFVFVSSGGTVYGPSDSDEPIRETHATNPICSHGITKLTVENFIKLHAHLDGLDYVIARVANPYGPGQVVKHGQGLIPALMARYAAHLPVTIFGDGSAARDFVYVDDVVDALVRSVESEGRLELVANIGTGVARSIMDVVRALEKVAEIEFQLHHVPPRASDVDRVSLDVTRAHEVLGWEPRTDFEDGLALTVEALRTSK